MAKFISEEAGTSGKQMTIYKDGQTTTAQFYKREGEELSEYERMVEDGWTDAPTGGQGLGDQAKGYNIGASLYKFFPEDVLNEYAKNWATYGEDALALSVTRQSQSWKNEFGYLERDDGSLIMSELEAVADIASYKETLREIGIVDTSMFDGKFKELVAGQTSPSEFQDRINLVYDKVVDNIPGVEKLFRNTYGIDTDAPTIFAALINPDINDDLLKGNIKSLTIAAEADAAGFTGSFERFDALRKAGLTQEGARTLYQSAENTLGMGIQTGSEISLDTLEQAAIGDRTAQETVGLLGAEAAAMSSARIGAKRKDNKVTGLTQY